MSKRAGDTAYGATHIQKNAQQHTNNALIAAVSPLCRGAGTLNAYYEHMSNLCLLPLKIGRFDSILLLGASYSSNDVNS